MAVALTTGMLCGLVTLPDVQRVSLAAVRDGGAPAVTGRNRARRLLLAAETAITFVLVVGAVLFVQTFANLSRQERGFDADRLLTVRVAPGAADIGSGLSDAERGTDIRSAFATFFGDLRARLGGIPGVVDAAAVSLGPLEGTGAGLGNIAVNGRRASTEETFTPIAFVTPGYFGVMQTPIVSGRDFNEADRPGADLVAIVNETFERRFAPDGGVIGARVTSEGGPETFTIVGVVRDVPDRSLRESPSPLLIAPLQQMPGVHISWRSLSFVLRTTEGDPLRIAPEVRRAIWAISPNIVINEIVTMDARLARGMRAERDSALLLGLFALAALAMAAIGVYGVAAYALAQRTKEIGIRVALGATRNDVRRLVMSQTLSPTLGGIAVGVAAAAVLTRLVRSMVYGVAPGDPSTFVLGVIILVSVALAASWWPARRAIRIDPVVALRYE
jgi:predicted permease